ncbi:MAG TPA: hypothetical protein PLJ21_12730, partial [Pseudobdellovibrionaceae bacterium]|nr:hypothetical protein [Pseudobdellovibrionaceae bacterium]
HQPVQINLNAGHVAVAGPVQFANHFNNILLDVKAGSITSNTVQSVRTNFYAGERGELRGIGGKPNFSIKVNAGLIQF